MNSVFCVSEMAFVMSIYLPVPIFAKKLFVSVCSLNLKSNKRFSWPENNHKNPPLCFFPPHRWQILTLKPVLSKVHTSKTQKVSFHHARGPSAWLSLGAFPQLHRLKDTTTSPFKCCCCWTGKHNPQEKKTSQLLCSQTLLPPLHLCPGFLDHKIQFVSMALTSK